ncbi:hypothetical protein [Cuneatibacter caecimuris]|uniref:hypothetical protein n=1 Tax=Cuneatibacter caecimuris TaxID=1796618 RepID=UPI0013EEB668|nr:hypothetical protein [Cuneatibacter caecimuris]
MTKIKFFTKTTTEKKLPDQSLSEKKNPGREAAEKTQEDIAVSGMDPPEFLLPPPRDSPFVFLQQQNQV